MKLLKKQKTLAYSKSQRSLYAKVLLNHILYYFLVLTFIDCGFDSFPF